MGTIVAISNVVKDNDLGFALRRFTRSYARLQRTLAARECGLTDAQCQLLSELRKGSQATVGELSQRLILDKGWISRSLQALCRRGLAVKAPNYSDGRSAIVRLTDLGERLAA